tara:strand:+ start:2184 stop:2333 length:150 start_codon:yes stop_codon:yes gene_type:complete
MKFKIYYEYTSGEEDFIIIEGETVEEIRKKADTETSKRGVVGLWSEEIK